jgi:hypothetical protein
MNTITSFGQTTFNVGGIQVIGNVQLNYTMTGSNMSAGVINVPTGLWTAMNTSSLTDVKYLFVENVSSASSGAKIFVSTTNSMTGLSSVLEIGDWSFISQSGSIQLWAAASGSSAGILSEIVVER